MSGKGKKRPLSGNHSITNFLMHTVSVPDEVSNLNEDNENVNPPSPKRQKPSKQRTTGFDAQWEKDFLWVKRCEAGKK